MCIRWHRWVLPAAALAVTLSAAAGWWFFHDLPPVEISAARLNVPSIRIEDRNGRLLYDAIDAAGGRHAVVPVGEIPEACKQAAVATEDRNFYHHRGIDPAGIARAVWINLRGGGTRAGGSTITQQVARNLLLSTEERGERSLRRKLREAVLAWRLTRKLSKAEILGLYLNQTYYGGMAYGIDAAARTFFGKPAAQLDIAECAMLAGMPQAPALYNPFTVPEAAKERQRVVLTLMEKAGYLSTGERANAEREPLVYAEDPYPMEAPHFVMIARAELDRLITADARASGIGLVVRTSLDLDQQKLAEAAVKRHLAQMTTSDDGRGHNINNAALVALDPQTGDILALVGSPDYFDSEHGGAINMARAPRQPGSALKPLIYAAAFEPGKTGGGWTAATMLLDVRTSFVTHDGKAYVPANYDLQEHGPVLAREALASSLNIPAVLALEHVGLRRFFEFAGRFGISTLGDVENYDLSLALGGGAVRLLDLTAAYGALANSGFRIVPRVVLEVRSADGEEIYAAPEPERVRILDERIAWLISDILSDADARRLGFGANSLLRIDRPAAVKTGTTSNFHDNWTVGYTPDLVVGVWSGNSSYEAMRAVNGLSGAAPIWHQFMRAALTGHPVQPFSRPPGIEQVEVCSLSGMLPTPDCPYRRREWFLKGTSPESPDTLYREVIVDSSTGRLADAATPANLRRKQVVLDLPPEAHTWARLHRLPLYADLLTDHQAAALPVEGPSALAPQPGMQSGSVVALRLISPASGSRFRISPRMSPEYQRILFEAVGVGELQTVRIWLDGALLASPSATPYRTWWQLQPGEHRAWAEADFAGGQTITSPVITFSVIEE